MTDAIMRNLSFLNRPRHPRPPRATVRLWKDCGPYWRLIERPFTEPDAERMLAEHPDRYHRAVTTTHREHPASSRTDTGSEVGQGSGQD